MLRKALGSIRGRKDEMKDNTRAKPISSLVKKLVPQNATTIIYGKHGSGMSTLGLYLCALAASSTPPMPCLYIDFEEDQKSIGAKWRAILSGQKLDKDLPLHYYRCNQPIVNEVKSIKAAIAAIKPELIVIDSLASAIPNSVDEKAATQGMKAIESLEVTRIAIAHLSRSSKEYYGSSILSNYARVIYEVATKQTGGQVSSLDITLSCKKFNYDTMPKYIRFSIKLKGKV